MQIIDRYIARQFIINYVMLSAMLLIIMIAVDFIGNIDEFLKVARDQSGLKAAGSVLYALVRFYWPKTFLFSVYTAGIIPIAAAGFTLNAMIRNRELVSLLAGGVSLYRITVPILALGFVASLLILTIQEVAIPTLRERIAEPHRYVEHGGIPPKPVKGIPDRDLIDTLHGDGPVPAAWTKADVFLPSDDTPRYEAAQFNYDTKTLEKLLIRRYNNGVIVERIRAASAEWDEDNRGWRLTGGTSERFSLEQVGLPASQRPVDFIPSGLDPTTIMLYQMNEFRTMLTTPEMIQMLERKTIIDPARMKMILHTRYSTAVVNVLILAIGLSFLMVRLPNQLWQRTIVAALISLPLWVGSIILSQYTPTVIIPAVAAWLPVIIYTPVALFTLDRVET